MQLPKAGEWVAGLACGLVCERECVCVCDFQMIPEEFNHVLEKEAAG